MRVVGLEFAKVDASSITTLEILLLLQESAADLRQQLAGHWVSSQAPNGGRIDSYTQFCYCVRQVLVACHDASRSLSFLLRGYASQTPASPSRRATLTLHKEAREGTDVSYR